jgi:hypothetical protein
MEFKLKKPCANCPFLKEGAIELAPGRLEGIIQGLVEDDHNWFMCHKTVYSKTGGHHECDEETGEDRYVASGRESQCVGAMTYLYKAGQTSVSMRLAHVTGVIDLGELEAQADKVIDPIQLPKRSRRRA